MSLHSPFTRFGGRLREFIARTARDGLPHTLPEADMGLDALFNELAGELFTLQFEHNLPYQKFCRARGIQPASIDHWSRVPAVPTAAFKELELTSLTPDERTGVFHSSGTTEQRPSRHFHDAESLSLYEASLLPWYAAHFRPLAGARHLFLTPPPAQAPRSSLAHMFETVRRGFASWDSVFTGGLGADNAWNLDLELTCRLMVEAVKAERPVVVLGTAFSFVHLLDHCARERLEFKLPRGSAVLETGGYKGRSRELPKAELHGLIGRYLGQPEIICEYGMSELSSQAYDCVLGESHGRGFRFPPWARVQIISPETGRAVGEGETGLIRLHDLANVRSVMAIQTEDLGVKRGDGFELLGRVAVAEQRGCSLMAQ
jgi:hypothetical protein